MLPLQEAKTDIAINDDLYKKSSTEVMRILGEMAKLNESGQANAPVFAALQRAYDFHQGQAEAYGAARDTAWSNFNERHADFCRQLLLDMKIVGAQQIPVLIEIRRDLGLISELSAFRDQMEAQWQRMQQQVDAALNAIQDRSPLR